MAQKRRSTARSSASLTVLRRSSVASVGTHQPGALERAACAADRSYGADGGGMRRFVACSNAYASSISRGSLQAKPVKLTPNGAGFAPKVSGNGGAGASGAFGVKPNGTMTVGGPGVAGAAAPRGAGDKKAAGRRFFLAQRERFRSAG